MVELQVSDFSGKGRGGYCRWLLAVLLLFLAGTVQAAEDRTPLPQLETRYRASVLRGWNFFHISYAADGVACVHCHPDHEAMRHWAPAYPKVEVFDGTPYAVKTLDQVVREALAKHSDLEDPERHAGMIGDLAAFIAWWGDGEPVRPGHSRPQPPADLDLQALDLAAERGGKLFRRRSLGPCTRCHGAEIAGNGKIPLAGSAASFPRFVPPAGKVMTLPAYLARHVGEIRNREHGARDRTITDLTAFLTHLARGRRYMPGGRAVSQE